MAIDVSRQKGGFTPLPRWWGWEELNVYQANCGGWSGIDAVIKFQEENYYGKSCKS